MEIAPHVRMEVEGHRDDLLALTLRDRNFLRADEIGGAKKLLVAI